MSDAPRAAVLVEDLFRRESARIVAALARWLGPSQLALAEDVVHDALVAAMQAWRLAPPRDPKAWILQTAKHRAIDRMRRLVREQPLGDDTNVLDAALTEGEDAENQLAMMFSICDERLGQATHVTMILRLLCGLSPAEIARAFLVDTATIDRRLHRGRTRLRQLGRLADVADAEAVRCRQSSVEHALYLLFNEGYHGSAHDPIHPALCTDAIRLGELLLELAVTTHPPVHALVALFCFHAARLPTRIDDDGVFVPLARQDRARWDRALVERGVRHLVASACGETMTRWHLEAGIAAEHALAPSLERTDWARIVALYDQLHARAASPVVALGRGLAIAELHGVDAGHRAVLALEARLDDYPFYWAARAELEQRGGAPELAHRHYAKAMALARSDAERRAYARKLGCD